MSNQEIMTEIVYNDEGIVQDKFNMISSAINLATINPEYSDEIINELFDALYPLGL